MERVGIYNRCSTEEEMQVNALNVQVEESRELAIKKGWIITAQYIESQSGTTVDKRKEYKRLLEDMESGKFDIVMIKSIDRLMRSAKDWYIFLDKLTRCGKKLYIYIENKYYTPDDSLLTGIKAILAEDFSRELSKKIKNAHRRRQNKKSGLNITVPLFGWNKVGKDVYEINEEEARAYRMAFMMASEGKGFYTIANTMYDSGIRSKSGRRISDVQWRNMIYSPRAHGTMILHTREYDFDTKRYIKVPETEWIYIDNALPPIVSREYHKQVLEGLLYRTEKSSFKGYTRDMAKVGLHELSGKLYCAECGEVYYRINFKSAKEKVIEWKCSRAIKEGRALGDGQPEKTNVGENTKGCNNHNIIEEELIEQLAEHCEVYCDSLFDKEERIVEDVMHVIQKALDGNSDTKELEKLERELQKQSIKKQVLFDKLLEQLITDNDFKRYNDEISNRMKELQNKIDSLRMKHAEYNKEGDRLENIRKLLEEGTILRKAKAKELLLLIDKIYIHSDNRLEICLNRMKIGGLSERYVEGVKEAEEGARHFRIEFQYIHKTAAVKRRETFAKRVLEMISGNSKVTLKELAIISGMSESYINTVVRQLKKEGRLQYIKNQKAWKVL